MAIAALVRIDRDDAFANLALPAVLGDTELDDRDPEDMLERAEQAAAAADVAVVVVGSNAEWESEGGDRGSMDLPAGQDDRVRRVAAANPNTVVVL